MMDRKTSRLRLARWLVTSVTFAVATSAMSDDNSKNPFAGNAEAAKEGKELYLSTGCYSCHGHEAEGAVGPDLTDDQWIFKPTDSMIFNTINRGRAGTLMAPFADQLKPEQIWKIVEFLREKNRQRNASAPQ
jgi:cytochrome c(L)